MVPIEEMIEKFSTRRMPVWISAPRAPMAMVSTAPQTSTVWIGVASMLKTSVKTRISA